MIEIVSNFFSDRYVKKTAVDGNELLLLMYRFAYPFSHVLNKYRISPNQITTTSTFLAILAAGSLVTNLPSYYFVVLWAVSLLLDFCDGTVARMSGQVSKTAFRYDHISDLFKIFIISIAVAIYYDSTPVWLAAMSASFFFMYYTVLNHELGSVRENRTKIEMLAGQQENKNDTDRKVQGFSSIVECKIKNQIVLRIVKTTYTILITINGHTLLLFLALPVSPKIAIIGFCYFSAISVFGIAVRIAALKNIAR